MTCADESSAVERRFCADVVVGVAPTERVKREFEKEGSLWATLAAVAMQEISCER